MASSDGSSCQDTNTLIFTQCGCERSQTEELRPRSSHAATEGHVTSAGRGFGLVMEPMEEKKNLPFCLHLGFVSPLSASSGRSFSQACDRHHMSAPMAPNAATHATYGRLRTRTRSAAHILRCVHTQDPRRENPPTPAFLLRSGSKPEGGGWFFHNRLRASRGRARGRKFAWKSRGDARSHHDTRREQQGSALYLLFYVGLRPFPRWRQQTDKQQTLDC